MLDFFNTWVTQVLVLAVLVFVHELGHFLLAKFYNVGVVKFSIGFGPSIFSFRYKQTTYQFSIIPLGGFVRMVGDMPDGITGPSPTDNLVRGENGDLKVDDEKKFREEFGVEPSKELIQKLANVDNWYIKKTFWPKFWIVFAGPLFNFIFAFFVLSFLFIYYGEPVSTIGGVQEGSPAEIAGLKSGDKVIAINNESISKWSEIYDKVSKSKGDPVKFKVTRSDKDQEYTVVPQLISVEVAPDKFVESYKIGVESGYEYIHTDPVVGLKDALFSTFIISKNIVVDISKMITGQGSAKDLAGPVFIFSTVSKQAKEGFQHVLNLMALLSLSLAILNLLPIPVLDGGHILFFILEEIFGPISIKIKEYAQTGGMAILLLLMVYALKNDVTRPPEKTLKKVDWKADKVSDTKSDSSSSTSAQTE